MKFYLHICKQKEIMRIVKVHKQESGLYRFQYQKAETNKWLFWMAFMGLLLLVMVLATFIQSPMQPFLIKAGLILFLLTIIKTKTI